jgi:hypothetical protein
MPFAFASSLIVVVVMLLELSTYKSIVIKIFAETYGKSR